MFIDFPAARHFLHLKDAADRQQRVRRRFVDAVPPHWLRITALAVNFGLWALIIWGVRLLLRL